MQKDIYSVVFFLSEYAIEVKIQNMWSQRWIKTADTWVSLLEYEQPQWVQNMFHKWPSIVPIL